MSLPSKQSMGQRDSWRSPVLCDTNPQDRGTHRGSRITESSYHFFPTFFAGRIRSLCPAWPPPAHPEISLCFSSEVQDGQRMGKLWEGPTGRTQSRHMPAVTLLPRPLCLPGRHLQSQSRHFSFLQLSVMKVERLGVHPGQWVIYSST